MWSTPLPLGQTAICAASAGPQTKTLADVITHETIATNDAVVATVDVQ